MENSGFSHLYISCYFAILDVFRLTGNKKHKLIRYEYMLILLTLHLGFSPGDYFVEKGAVKFVNEYTQIYLSRPKEYLVVMSEVENVAVERFGFLSFSKSSRFSEEILCFLQQYG